VEPEGTSNRPPGWIGGVLELPPFLAASATAAVGLRWAVAYPQGIAITILGQSAHSVPGWTAYGSGVIGPMWSVEFDGGGSRRLTTDESWLSPLPEGGFEIVVAWPEEAIAERRLRVDAAVLADALARARPIAGDHG
jgi:hypothetical protein